jgi:aspartyl-tRNA(Asn)/glutamyl-tRNA(Gln) amidotransferase subunit B
MENYVATIGLEVHVQLRTRSKMFCGCPVMYGTEPNAHTCPVCLGLPGSLPVMNKEALKMTALTGLMLGCQVAEVCKFDRKNYFYPDMPKNYQISQYDLPICLGGGVPLPDMAYPKDAQKSIANPDKVVRLVRIHLEEDVAKSFHFETSTGIDFNRAGTPLMEIVSEPEIDSPEEAFAYLTSLKQILEYGDVSYADMEKGQLRCDCNVSVRPEGQAELGTKIEIKNMNTISGVRRALAYEIERQIAVVKGGGKLRQETRRWDEAAGQTFAMRTKELAHDYRYFPDPDLMPVRTADFMTDVRKRVPELPAQKRERFVKEYGVSEYDAGVLASELELAQYYERAVKGAVKGAAKPKQVANWVLNDLQSALKNEGLGMAECPLKPEALNGLVGMIEAGKISSTQGKEVFAGMFAAPGKTAEQIAEEKGLKQESDAGAIEAICDEVLAANPKAIAEYKAGKTASINFLKGQVMKLSKGKANPNVVGEVLTRKLAP